MIHENTPTLETQRLILRKFCKTDAQALYEILRDEDANTFLPWFPLKNMREAREFLQNNFLVHYQRPAAYRYAICLKPCTAPIGYAWLSCDESCDFGYGLKKEFWHRGIATEAAMSIVAQIKNAGFSYITATHDKNNPRSGAIMKKLGMDYKYSYVEHWQPKNISVTFRMYQLNFDGDKARTYMKYWNSYTNHMIEDNLE